MVSALAFSLNRSFPEQMTQGLNIALEDALFPPNLLVELPVETGVEDFQLSAPPWEHPRALTSTERARGSLRN